MNSRVSSFGCQTLIAKLGLGHSTFLDLSMELPSFSEKFCKNPTQCLPYITSPGHILNNYLLDKYVME